MAGIEREDHRRKQDVNIADDRADRRVGTVCSGRVDQTGLHEKGVDDTPALQDHGPGVGAHQCARPSKGTRMQAKATDPPAGRDPRQQNGNGVAEYGGRLPRTTAENAEGGRQRIAQ